MAPQAVEATGIPLGEFIGKTNEELGMPPDLCATWNGLFHKVCASKQMQSVVFDFPGPKEIKTYLLKVVPEFAPDGSVESYLGISTDITEHKKAEDSIQQLLKSVQREKDRLLTLINSIPDEVWCFNADGTIELVNPPVVREFGGDLINLKEAAKLNDNSEIYQPDGQPRQAVDSPPLRALRGEVVVGQEEVVRAPSSGELRRRQVNASPVKDAEGNIVGAVAIVRDITERKRAEEELRRALAKAEEGRNTLDALMSHIPMGITIADAPDVKIRMISKQGQRIMDRAESEIAHIPSPLHPSRWGCITPTA